MATATATEKATKFRDMTPDQKKEYYAQNKAKRDAKKANKFVAPAGATYIDDKGKFTFTTAPAEYDAKNFADLAADDFAREDIFLDYRAGLLEQRAAKLRKEAEMVRKGGPRLKGESKKLISMLAKFEAMKKALAADGIDVAELIASAQSQQS